MENFFFLWLRLLSTRPKTYLTVEAEQYHHEEEERAPNRGYRQLSHGFRVGDEGQTGAGSGHLGDVNIVQFGHEAQDGENDETGENTGAAVGQGK